VSTNPVDQRPPGAARWFQRTKRDEDREALSPLERAIAEALVEMRELEVRDVMTPRIDVVALTIPVDGEDVASAVRESGHSCFPVVSGDLDDLIGVLYVNDLFRVQRKTGPLPSIAPIDISKRIRKPLILPESLLVLEAVELLREARRTFAVVTDEFGGVAGVITVKDLLEPLVGELSDEFDPQEEPEMVPIDAERWLVDGQASFDDVEEFFSVELEDGEYVTIAGFVMDRIGKLPEVGNAIIEGGLEFKVAEMEKRRITRLVVQRVSTALAEEGPEEVG